ncbi:hypothetical protein JHK82_031901 [Glycine max]|nr:hypothetical protein JHK86_031998 [Glycine max]KAG5125164.1 hypothetical protein JHK82_031901 [Glycine max]
MGNEKANCFWEAELPPNYDRVGIENFIRAKYDEKRWVPRDGNSKTPSGFREEKSPSHWQRPVERSGYAAVSENKFEERKKIQPSTAIPAARINVPAPPRASEQVTPITKPQHVEKVESVAPQPQAPQPLAETSKQATDTVKNTPPKVDYATYLFNMLSMDGPNENGSEAAGTTTDDNHWAAAAEVSTAEKTSPLKAADSTPASASGIEDLFKDLHPVTPSLTPEKPQRDVKNDIMSLFEKAISFADFFLANILTSMAKVFSDLERSVCRMVHRQVATIAWLEADSVCGSHSVAIPLVLVLPYLFRLNQCLRQYKDTGEKTTLLNALKYSTAVPMIFLSALKYHVFFLERWTNFYRPLWLLSGVVNSSYSFYWDVNRDWDLRDLLHLPLIMDSLYAEEGFSIAL